MKHFEVFLDESGSFKNIGSPSMVSGFLCQGNDCDTKWATHLLEKVKTADRRFADISIDPFHAMETNNSAIPDFIATVIESMTSQKVKIVEFKNLERIDIVNSDITYLNVFAEGIVQLVLQLLAETEDKVDLRIVFAHRRDMAMWENESKYERIPVEEYETRIAERIILRLARLPERIRNRCSWKLERQDAIKYKPLMIADAICFALRGGRKQFSAFLKERIDQLPAYRFTVIEHASWTAIQENIVAGRLADAIYIWYSSDDRRLENYKTQFKEQMIGKLSNLGSLERRLQFRSLSYFIDNLIWSRRYDIANRLLDKITEEFMPIITSEGINEPIFSFDVPFYRLTIATHQGDIATAEKHIATCRAMLPQFATRWETLDYYLSYKIREAEHQKNTFDFLGAIETLNQIEKILNETVGLFHLINELGDIGENIRSSTMGKVLGSRLLARCYLLEQQSDQSDLARHDSDAAIEQFQEDYDKARQYQYRAMIEYESGQYNEALFWLGKSFCAPKNSTVAQLLRTILEFRGEKIFGITHYVRIMAECLLNGEELGQKMHLEWGRQKAENYLNGQKENPIPIIYWKLGTSSAKVGAKSASQYYEDAIRLSYSDSKRFTNRAMGLAMEAERLALLEQNMRPKNCMQKLLRSYYDFMDESLPSSMRTHFTPWEKQLIEASKASINMQKEILYNLSRQVPVI